MITLPRTKHSQSHKVPILAELICLHNSPLAKCGCKKFCMDLHSDLTSTCTAHSGATKAHDWMVSVLGPLFRTAGHVVRTQHGVTASAGQRRGDVEIRNYLRVSASPMTGLGQAATCSRTGACRNLRIWMRRCVLLRKIAAYQQQYADNQNISFLPAIVRLTIHPHAWRVFTSSFSTGPPGD